ncbi:MAG: hypothetical protein OEM93_17635 [Rhodospirillales bacterium]|nr:hypothetical protein [Rhodospirillales bacterium]MDH3917896.1 hypothetical protein [Rhodospirillales bacterium]
MELFLIAFAVVVIAFLGLASGLLLGRGGLAGGCRGPRSDGCAGCSARQRRSETP